MPPLVIRPATVQDLPAITAIYNHAILHTTATFDTEPKTDADQLAWFQAHGERHPILVAAIDGQVVGWASLSAWSDRCAYSDTAEVSTYVDAKARHETFPLGTSDPLEPHRVTDVGDLTLPVAPQALEQIVNPGERRHRLVGDDPWNFGQCDVIQGVLGTRKHPHTGFVIEAEAFEVIPAQPAQGRQLFRGLLGLRGR